MCLLVVVGYGIYLQRQRFQAQPLKKLEASMATDEPFSRVLAGLLIPRHTDAESKELGRWVERFASPKQ